MGQAGATRKPTFLWQGLLIVLPVALLAVVGVVSLRQDRLLARYEATERAQLIADELLPRLWTELTGASETNWPGQVSWLTDASGLLRFPPSLTLIPEPRTLDASGLETNAAELWLSARAAESSGQDPQSAIRTYREFLALDPPGSFSAAAYYSLGVLLAATRSTEAAREAFQTLLDRYPSATGESGLPLGPLAQIKLLEFAPSDSSVADGQRLAMIERVCSNVVCHPTLLTSCLLSRARELSKEPGASERIRSWEQEWQQHELARELFTALRPQLPVEFYLHSQTNSASIGEGPHWLWFEYAGRKWLAAEFDNGPDGHRFVCRDEASLGSRLNGLASGDIGVPDYLGIGIEVAGRKLAAFAPDLRVWQRVFRTTKGGAPEEKVYSDTVATDVVASSARQEKGKEWLNVSVYLTSPATLYRRQSARSFWFGSLIAAAAVSAFIGLIAAYRGFHRQLRLSELKSNFVSSVSHELRAPIASVRLMAESLEHGKVTEPSRQYEYFRFIGQECRRLSSLIENVLDFSRIERGRKEYEFEPTDFVALAKQTVQLMETYAVERSVTLELNLSEFPADQVNGRLLADGKALQQALINLVDNAIKHSPKGGTVRVGLELRYAGSVGDACRPTGNAAREISRLMLWVEDHGDGIPAAEHEKIFERFYRCGSELRRETPGVGVGLSIVKHIVEAHGGTVRVESEVGRGSTFTIELPATNTQ